MGVPPADVERARLAGLTEHGARLGPFLAPGEALHAAIPVHLNSDIKDPPEKGDALLRGASRAFDPAGTVLDGVFGLFSIGSRKAWDGGWESHAGQFIISAYPCKKAEGLSTLSASLQFVSTDRRILVVHMPKYGKDRTPSLIAQFNPGQLRNSPEPPKRRNRRAEVVFPDGSWLALLADTPQHADLLRHVLGASA